ncbi:hypothetical protein HYU19_00955 [Candidatus Woesearchaeota archaeon]|nr:hypothetical protein [Candidatus Woesearchaeota archaeon]
MDKKRGDAPYPRAAVIIVLAFVAISIAVLSSFSEFPTGDLVLQKLDVNENIGQEYRSLTSHDWDGLADGSLFTNEGKAEYSQFIVFQDNVAGDPIESCTRRFAENEEGEPGDYLVCKNGDDIFEYRMSFSAPLRSEIQSNDLVDLTGKSLSILGQDFTISSAELRNNAIELHLSGSPVQKTLVEGSKETISVGSSTILIEVFSVSDTATPPTVVLRVNGNLTPAMEKGKTLYASDIAILTVLDIVPNEAGEGTGSHGDMVTILAGPRSIVMEDADITDNSFTAGGVQVNGDRLVDSKLKIQGSTSNSVVSISALSYRLEAAGPGGDVFVPTGSWLSLYHRAPMGLLSSAFDLSFSSSAGTSLPSSSATGGSVATFDARDSNYDLEFVNNNGQQYDVRLLSLVGNTLKYGTEEYNIIFTEGRNASDYVINQDDRFITTAGSEGKGRTHILHFDGVQNGNAVFTDLSGNTKIIGLLPTGAFFLDSIFGLDVLGGEKISAPITYLTGYQAADLQDDRAGSSDAADPGFKKACDRISGQIKSTMHEEMSPFGVQISGDQVIISMLGAKPFNVCSEFMDYLMNENAFPPQVQQATDDCMNMYGNSMIPDEAKTCYNYEEMSDDVYKACNDEMTDMVREINYNMDKILDARKKCQPQKQADIDAWNLAHGIDPNKPYVPSPEQPVGQEAAPGEQAQRENGNADDQQYTPPDWMMVPPEASPFDNAPASSSGSDSNPPEAPQDEGVFICCESCPSTPDARFYVPFSGNTCEPGDARRDDLTRMQCGNPLYDKPYTGPATYGKNCPNPKDVETKQQCEDAKNKFSAVKAAYERAVQLTRTAWQGYEQSKYTDAGAKAVYDAAFQEAHDLYFNEFIKARDAAQKLCDAGIDATPQPEQRQAPSVPSTGGATLPSPKLVVPPPGASPPQLAPGSSSTVNVRFQPVVKTAYLLPGSQHVVVEADASFLNHQITICRGDSCVSFMPEVGENCATESKCSMDVPGEGEITVKLDGVPARMDSQPSATQTTNSPATPSCTDSDGKDFNNQGKVTGIDSNGVGFEFTDSCLGLSMLNEYICNGVEPQFINVECDCEGGACKEKVNRFTPQTVLPANTPSCTDSDGGINYYKKGTAIEVSETGKVHEEHDFCADSIFDMKYPDRAETLVEVYCDQNKIRDKSIKCLCMGGQCVDIKKNPDPESSLTGPIPKNEGGSCTDTDGDNPKTQGSATETRADGSSRTYKDMCHDPHTLYESICKGDVYGVVSYDCDCQGDHCVEPQERVRQGKGSCTDSDGGFEPYTSGFTSGALDDGTPFQHYDECFYDEWKYVGEPLQKEEYLIEQVCAGDKPEKMDFSLCTNCQEGACERQPQPSPETPKTAAVIYQLPGTNKVVLSMDEPLIGKSVTLCRGKSCVTIDPKVGENCASETKCSADVPGEGGPLQALVNDKVVAEEADAARQAREKQYNKMMNEYDERLKREKLYDKMIEDYNTQQRMKLYDEMIERYEREQREKGYDQMFKEDEDRQARDKIYDQMIREYEESLQGQQGMPETGQPAGNEAGGEAGGEKSIIDKISDFFSDLFSAFQSDNAINEPPQAATFDKEVTTDFSTKTLDDLKRVDRLTLGRNGLGKIEFAKAVDARGLNLDESVIFSKNRVEVDSSKAPELDKPAIVTLENVDMINPVIYKDGKPCESCTIVEYNKETKQLTFTVEGFTAYEAIDAAGLGQGSLVLSGVSYEFFINPAGDKLVVDQNADGTLNGAAIPINIMGNGILELGAAGSPTDITLRTLKRYLSNSSSPDETTTIRFSVTDGEIGVSLPGLRTYDAGDYEEAMTVYGTHFRLEDTTRRNDLIVEYPSRQRSASVNVGVER